MGLYDDIDNEVLNNKPVSTSNNNVKNSNVGLFDDIDAQVAQPQVQPTFADNHPIVASVPEAFKQFGTRAVKSYPEFAKGLNDLIALAGDKTGIQGLSDFGRSNADFWQEQSDKIQIDPKYQGVNGLKNKATFLPTVAGSIGDQATNLLTAMGGGAGGAKVAAQVGAKGLAKAGLITAGSSLPNVAQEGSYLDKIQAFQEINGRIPTIEEMKYIQNVALGEKLTNTALETVSDRLLFGKLFPNGTATKGVKSFLKNAGEQAITEAGTEGMQEGVSIGAEKLLGINQGDNLSRLADSMAIGGITGGTMGGVTHLASQPYESQFAENPNAVNPVEAVKSVSGKILSNGQVFYDDTVNALNNAAQNLNNMVNTPDTFDTLRELSRNGNLSGKQTFEELAPNTAKSEKNKNRRKKATDKINNSSDVQAQDTGVSNMLENTNLYNVSENGENTITNEDTVNNIANEVDNTSSENTAVLEKPQTPRERKKAKAKAEVINKLKEIAPNTAAKIETENKNTKEANLFRTNQFVKDNDGNVYETTSNGYIRNVDTDEHSTGDVNRTYEAYTPNESEFIKVEPFKYDKDAKGDTNAHNYAMSKQEVVDSYNNYIKEPTVANREAYQDTYGKFTEEFNKKEENIKNNPASLEGYPLEKTKNLIPFNPNDNKFSNLEKVDSIDEATHHDMINGGFYKQKDHIAQPSEMVESAAKNDEIEKVAKQYAEMLGQNEIHDFHRDFAEALIDKKVDRIKELVAHGRGFNENSKKMFTKYTGIKLPTTIKGKIETLEKWSKGEIQKEEEPTFNNSNKTITFKEKDLTTKSGGKAIKISDKYVTNGYIAFVKDYFNFANKESDFEFIDTTKKDYAFNREFNTTLDKYINSDVYTEKLSNPLLTKNRGNSYILFKNGDKYVAFDKKYYDLVKDFDIFTEKNSNNSQAIIRNKSGESIGILMPVMLKDLNTALSIAKPVKLKKNDAIYSSSRISNESEVENGRRFDENVRPSNEQSSNELVTNGDEHGRGLRQNEEEHESNTRGRGISQKDKEIIEKQYKNQHELNKAIEDYINNEEYRKYAGSVNMPQAVKDWLKKYAGAGGLEKQGAEGKGLLSEYYTPQNIVDKMWDLTAQYVETDGAKVLEPSVGIGRFLENAPQNTNFDVVEMNPVSAKITKILYPDANVTTGEFQEKFIDKANNKPVKSVTPEYDIVIGNPPYGQYSGRYKGLGEGKKHSRLESYFINRGLDSLKENGIMTFIVPSSFLDSAITTGKQEIATKCELVDAYRLPENTFDTTSIGTDIIVLRKTQPKSADRNLSLGNWFKENPDKILGTTEERKNRFGKQETFVKGDKNAVENIDTSKKDVKKTVVAKSATTEKTATKKSERVVDTNKTSKKPATKVKGKVEYTEYESNNVVSADERKYFEDTLVDGTLPKSKYEVGEKVNQFNGELYNDFNYLQGDIYEKLEQLEVEDISDEQKAIQKAKLEKVLPKLKTADEIQFNPTSEFMLNFKIPTESSYYNNGYKTSITDKPISETFAKYVDNLTNKERNGVTNWNIRTYLNGGNRFSLNFRVPDEVRNQGEKAIKSYKERKLQEAKIKIKNTTEKLFNDFIRNELDSEQKDRLVKEWNREFNNNYTPDYKKMPLLVKGLNSTFKGKKLKLQEVQIEGINFLTNKGVGLAGFEVGVGKTMTGIIATVQNMQMGRCKRPLILVPSQTKDNWIREINELFPNMVVNDAGNFTKFNGVIEDNTITVATHEALDSLWYEKSNEELASMFESASKDYNKEIKTNRQGEVEGEKYSKMVGTAEKGNKKLYTVEGLGIDHILVDEAHNYKNLFGGAKAQVHLNQQQNLYQNISGGESDRAKRMFLLTQHILQNNGNRNVFMLTATPFNNSPLEIYNMLSYLAKDKLDSIGLNNVYQFMEHYADITSEWILNYKNETKYETIVKGFKNLSSLRELIKNSMIIRSAEDAGVQRPNKHNKSPKLEPNQAQLEIMQEAEQMAASGSKDDGAVLKAIGQLRMAALSPDIANKNFGVSPKEFIKNSPKLDYIMECVKSMKKSDPKTSQLIYMPVGVDFLPKIKQYLVDEGIYKANEVQIVDSKVKKDKLIGITDSFNDPKGDIKLIIGTEVIKEGMNLNKNSSVLYIPFLDWNPTDYLQTVGRIWRQGNEYDDIRVVTPILKNSADSFMVQKLETKSGRINSIMDESKDYIELSDIMTPEDKINMITLPDKKIKMFKALEQQRLSDKKNDIEANKQMVNYLKSELESTKREVESYKTQLKDYKEKLNGLQEADGWKYEYAKKDVDSYSKYLKEAEYKLKSLEKRIKTNEIDFEGKDSIENIEKQIAEVEKEIAELEEVSTKKLAEFEEQYAREQENSKSIADLIKDFENDTINLYGEKKPHSEDSKVIDTTPTKKYEKTRENAYNVPVIKLETATQKKAKSRTKERIEKAKNIVDARKYNKVLKEGVQKWNSEIGIRRYEADRTLNSFINITKAIAKEHKINDKNLREIMPFLRERTEFPESLNRPELKKVWDKVHSTKGLAERLTQLADSLSEKFDKFWQEYKAIQASSENLDDNNDVKNYINHEWDLDNKQQKLLTTFFATKSKHGKQRTIDTYYKGIEGIELENGEIRKFKPKTLDYAELLKMQSDSLIKATIDKAFADSVKSFKTSDGSNLVLPSSQAPSNWVEINHSALNKTVARPVSTKYGEKISPELQNKLAEMGIAIGNRLPKHKGNGQLNSAGKYVRNIPPEIRLQRWFSNKTLAHEIGHAIDDKLELTESGFVSRHKEELLELNKERIDAFSKAGDRSYAEKDTELIAELFGTLFNDIETAYKIAPAATSEVIEKMTKGKLDSLLPANFDWSEAKHILEEKVVEFFKIPVRVHPDIAATLKTVFESKKEYLDILGFKPGQVMDEQTALMKMMEFSVSGFHNVALTESYLGNVGIGGLKEALNFKKIFNSVKNNEYDVYKNNKVAEQAIKDGLQIGTPLDIDRGTVETLINNVGSWAENNIKGLGKSLSLVAKTTEKGINLNNKALWDVIHNNYKLNTYELLVQNESKDGIITEAKRKEIASWVNDSFGGQVIEALGINPSTKKQLSRWLMSPDWLISTTRQFMGIFASEKGHKKLNQLAENSEGWQKVKDITQSLGITSITDDVTSTGMRGRIARAFWVRSAILSALYMNILNALFRMWDKDKYPELYPEKLTPKDYSMLGNSTGAKLYIFIGRNADGTERYLRLGKQFREVPEMVADPIKHFGNKLSPAIQTGIVTATGHSVGGFKDKEIANAKGWKRIGLAAKNLGSKYVPLSIQNAYNKTVKKQGADFTPFDLIGNTSKGMSEYKAKEQFLNAFQHGNNPKKIAEIEKSMTMNGFSQKDIKKVEKSAKTSYTKQFKDGYKTALMNGDNNKIQQISDKMTKNNISPIDQRKIYTKALSEYYKEMKIKD